jgi:hypothetical protein
VSAAHKEHRERLRGAVFHCARDDEAQSWLVGLELPDAEYAAGADETAVTAYVAGQVENVQRVLMDAWQSWPHGLEDTSE